ncbi:2-oxopent-4-enoate hydratase, partial [Pseudomonas sp. HMWF031]
MSHSSINTQQLGDKLFNALVEAHAIAPLTESHPDLSLEQAYQIQQHLIGCRLASGERIIGKKIGVTSQAVMDMLGVR